MEDLSSVTLYCFINALLGNNTSDSVEEAHRIGIIDKYEAEHSDIMLLRKDAARILHLYMTKVLSVRDEEDITAASVIKDLYDCRVCVNHIAQVYLKGIMKAHEYPKGLLLFDSGLEILDDEAKEAITNINCVR
jgi:hypothetical protein